MFSVESLIHHNHFYYLHHLRSSLSLQVKTDRGFWRAAKELVRSERNGNSTSSLVCTRIGIVKEVHLQRPKVYWHPLFISLICKNRVGYTFIDRFVVTFGRRYSFGFLVIVMGLFTK